MVSHLVNVRHLTKSFELAQTSEGLFARSIQAPVGIPLAPSESRVTKPVGSFKAVDDLSLTIPDQQTLGLVGESGCGKSTVARCLARLSIPDSGEVIFNGQSVFGLRHAELKSFHRQVQIVFQDPVASLDPRATIARTLLEPLRVHNLARGEARRQRINELLDAVQLREDHLHRLPHQLSGGECQRVAIARALATNPRFLILDEPTSALDASARVRVIRLLKELKEARKMTYLVISHDISIIRHLADQVAVMYLGHIVELALTAPLMKSPRHPYTQALLSAVPIPEPGQGRQRIRLKGDLDAIPGEYEGCPLAERCNHAIPECRDRPQSLTLIESDHYIACHRVSEGQIQ